ncbi:MAG: glycosyltransferase [Candidatus Accumulibacter sp.]|jgi:glycosyltransferase involved in cell wall biosynthesis|nr:glycosyltransferase [Accumulibacter sp.]
MISVVMLAYNRESLVTRAIESILAQTFRDFEFIIVNNGSTDRSGAIADDYAAKDARIGVIHRAHGNIGSGRNAGLDASRGEWIAFVDDDDWCEPDFLEFLHRLAVENGADVAICGAAGRAFDEKRIMNAEEALIELMWRKRYNVQFPTKLLRRELFDHARFSREAKYDDIDLMPKILAGVNRVAYHGLPKYTFFRHPGNNSAWTTNHALLNSATLGEYLRVYRERTQWLTERFPDSAATWRYFEWSFMISMVDKITRLGTVDCNDLRSSMLADLCEHCKDFLNSPHILEFEREWVNKYLYVTSEPALQ